MNARAFRSTPSNYSNFIITNFLACFPVDDLKLKQRALHREIIGFSQSVNEKSSGAGRGQP